MRLWLHVNYRQFFQGRRGWGGGSVSMYSTHMNGRNLPKKLYPDIILLFPRETGDEGWSRVTATPKNAHRLYCEPKNRFHHRPDNVILFLCGMISLFLQQKEAEPLLYFTEQTGGSSFKVADVLISNSNHLRQQAGDTNDFFFFFFYSGGSSG